MAQKRGDIEKAGTGTSDMVKKCFSMGLKKPLFIQDENLKVVIWRNPDDQVHDQDDAQVSVNNLFKSLSEKRIKRLFQLKNEMEIETILLLEALKKEPLSKYDLLQNINMVSHTDTTKRYKQLLLNQKLISLTIKDKPTSPNQKYKNTKLGDIFLNFLKENINKR
jgi:predicted HTH transcriptional regulator